MLDLGGVDAQSLEKVLASHFILVHVGLQTRSVRGADLSVEDLLHEGLSQLLFLEDHAHHDGLKDLVLHLALARGHNFADNVFDSLNSQSTFI